MKNFQFIPIFLFLIISSCARPYYQVDDFEQLTKSHETVAILPFEIYTFGKLPKDVDEEMLFAMESLESTNLQAEFYEGILESKSRDQELLSVNLQHYDETNSILKENEISVRESWSYSPEELAKILNVDAVLLARVEKEQSFSDGASAAIEIGQVILSILATDTYIDGGAQNKILIGDYALVGHDGVVLWQMGSDRSMNWKNNTDRCVSRMNSRSAKFFPY